MKKTLISLIILMVGIAPSHATPTDLSSWTVTNLDFNFGQISSHWDLSVGNGSVSQTLNADPSFFLNNNSQSQYSFSGSLQTLTGTTDGDYIGFVFGYQNSSNFYVFDWKGEFNTYEGATANEGMTIKKFTGANGDGLLDLTLADLWENENDTGNMTILDKNQSLSSGWVAGSTYDFNLEFDGIAGEFSIVIMDGATELWSTTIIDSTFSSGEFGFYNYSQLGVQYAGSTGGTTVSEPASLTLLLLGFCAFSFFYRKISPLTRTL